MSAIIGSLSNFVTPAGGGSYRIMSFQAKANQRYRVACRFDASPTGSSNAGFHYYIRISNSDGSPGSGICAGIGCWLNCSLLGLVTALADGDCEVSLSIEGGDYSGMAGINGFMVCVEGDLTYPSSNAVGMSQSPSAVVFQGNLYAFHMGPGEDGTLRYNVFNGTAWQQTQQVQDNIPCMAGSPGAVVFNGQIYVFHLGPGDDGLLWYNVFDGTSWKHHPNVDGVHLSGSPSAVVFNGWLYIFFQGPSDNGSLCYCQFDGTNWATGGVVPNCTMSGSPSAVVFNNQLFVIHKSWSTADSGEMWYSVLDSTGTKWSDSLPIGYAHGIYTCKNSPSAVIHDGVLKVFRDWGDSNDSMRAIFYDGTNWQGDQPVPATTMSASPGAAVFGGILYVLHQGSDNDGCLWWNAFDGTSWQGDQKILVL